jgi:hypothetical protein
VLHRNKQASINNFFPEEAVSIRSSGKAKVNDPKLSDCIGKESIPANWGRGQLVKRLVTAA